MRAANTRAEVAWVAGPWPGRLGIVPRPRGGDWLDDDVRSWRDAGVDAVVSLLTPEEVVELGLEDEESKSRKSGLVFLSFAIPDRGVPESQRAMAELVSAIERVLGSGGSVAVHCRQGIGRSALVVASALVLAGASPDEAFRSIEAARGTPVPETAAQRRWVERLTWVEKAG